VCSEEDEINRCIGVLDEILDLYDADVDDAELYGPREPAGDVTSHLLPLQSCARTAVRNLEIRKSMSAGFTALYIVDARRLSLVLLLSAYAVVCFKGLSFNMHLTDIAVAAGKLS